MMSTGTRLFSFFAALTLALSLMVGAASARDRLTDIGARLSAVGVDPARVTVSRTIVLGGDGVAGTFVTAHTASGKALQRNHLGFWVPWDGRLASLTDNRFSIAGDQVTFKILKDEDMSAELFPIRITVAYRTPTALKFGIFELRGNGSGAGR
jgi:hypothetical protein